MAAVAVGRAARAAPSWNRREIGAAGVSDATSSAAGAKSRALGVVVVAAAAGRLGSQAAAAGSSLFASVRVKGWPAASVLANGAHRTKWASTKRAPTCAIRLRTMCGVGAND